MLKIERYDEVTRINSARTFAGKGYYWTTFYLVDGMLVDTGCAHTAREVAAELAHAELISITNTHSHEDHIGANGILARILPGLEIRAHPLAIPILEDPRRMQPLRFYRRLFWGWPEPSTAVPTNDGDFVETDHYRFRVIHTPGHAADHICLYEEEQGWLFSGDLYVGGKDRALRVDYDICKIIESLKRVAGLRLTRLFPGSARVKDNPHQELADKIAYLEETGERITRMHQAGMSINKIALTVFGGPMWVETITAGHFTRRGLVNSFLGQQEQVEHGKPFKR